MKFLYKDYIIKVRFRGDSITPIYRYTLYKPRKYWFPKMLWIEDIHRDHINKIVNKFDFVIRQYKREVNRWKVEEEV